MGIGRKIGRGFAKLSRKGKQINDGLDDLLGENRTKPGEGFNQKRTAKKTAGVVKKDNSDKLAFGSKDSSNYFGKSREKDEDDKDRRFF